MPSTLATAPPQGSPPGDAAPLHIGVFDSGVGGLSVLRHLRALLPGEGLRYVADSGHAPYGERDDAFVVARSERIAGYLLSEGAQMLVVACNTATAAAVQRLRERWPQIPIVGVEPGLKPAVAASRNGKVGVLATTSTLRSGKFQKLLEQYGTTARVLLQACPGLATQIELGDADAPELASLVSGYCAPLREAQVDVVVLGCTHYAFALPHIEAAMGPEVQIIDTAHAVARHAASLSAPLTRVAHPSWKPGPVHLVTTGDVERLRLVAERWLPFNCTLEARPSL